jgi:hydrogenase large subunit
MAVASFYKDWGAIGGFDNFMAFGDFPMQGYNNTDRANTFKFPSGVILNRDLTHVLDADLRKLDTVEEYVNNSWYDYTGDANAGKQPWSGETNIHYTGPKPPYQHLDVSQKYSFIKTPRWKGQAMEVGPLARVLVGYALGKPEYKTAVDAALKQLQVPATALFSTLGRTLARCLETQIVANWNLEFYDQLINNIKNGDTKMANMEKWDPATWAPEAKGVGLLEAPRGGLSHWIVIKNGKVDNYQQVVPSTWNASPRDPKGQRSPYESTLIGTPVANPELPLEIIRTIHSFDPCIACAVHLYDENGDIVKEVNDISVCEI